MYSYEVRIQAVKLYIKLDKRATATIPNLGYPQRKAIRSWYREFERKHDLRLGYARTKPRYPDAKKKSAVEHYLQHGQCLAATVKSLGTSDAR